MLVRLTSVVCIVKKRSNWYFLIADGWRGGGPTIEINTDKKPRRLLVRPIEAAEMLACSKAKVYELVKAAPPKRDARGWADDPNPACRAGEAGFSAGVADQWLTRSLSTSPWDTAAMAPEFSPATTSDPTGSADVVARNAVTIPGGAANTRCIRDGRPRRPPTGRHSSCYGPTIH